MLVVVGAESVVVAVDGVVVVVGDSDDGDVVVAVFVEGAVVTVSSSFDRNTNAPTIATGINAASTMPSRFKNIAMVKFPTIFSLILSLVKRTVCTTLFDNGRYQECNTGEGPILSLIV